MSEPLLIFYSYNYEDEPFRKKLEQHLKVLERNGVVRPWSGRNIAAGTEWKGQIDENLERADMILLLVSANFVGSDYCYDIELRRALERHERGEARVIPIILSPVDWHEAPFGKLQALPLSGKAVNTWQNQDEAWLDVAKSIRKITKELRAPKSSVAVPAPIDIDASREEDVAPSQRSPVPVEAALGADLSGTWIGHTLDGQITVSILEGPGGVLTGSLSDQGSRAALEGQMEDGLGLGTLSDEQGGQLLFQAEPDGDSLTLSLVEPVSGQEMLRTVLTRIAAKHR